MLIINLHFQMSTILARLNNGLIRYILLNSKWKLSKLTKFRNKEKSSYKKHNF